MALWRGLAVSLTLLTLGVQGFAQTTPVVPKDPAPAVVPVAPQIQIAPIVPDAAQAPAVPQTEPQTQLQPLPVPKPQPKPDTTVTPAQTTESPAIEIAPDTANPADAPPPPPPLMTRDAGLAAAGPTPADSWRLPLVPTIEPVPTDVRMGSSMPEPGQFRISGEVASAEFVLSLPEGVAPGKELLLALRSSANVLPDHSTLTVWVNDMQTGSLVLDNIADFAEKRVPVTGLVPGDNKIRLVLVQQHRIFCGPDASFGVWTEVNLGQSGVLVDPAAMPLTPQGFLAALRAQVSGGGMVEVRAGGQTDMGLVRAVANRVVGAIGDAPAVKVQPFYSVQTGAMAKARVALIAGAVPKASFRRGAGGAIVLQVEYSGANLPDLATLLPLASHYAVIPAMTPGRTTTLTDLIGPEIIGNTHYFRQDVNFLLPEDWLLLASQKAEFTLHYGFSADLAKGALLLVKVNGQTTRLLPLDVGGGKLLPPLDMKFGASMLNPGLNTVTFEMTVPGDPPELPCTPRKTDMLVILGDSNLTVPPSPRMQQADISRSLARLDGTGVVIPAEAADPAHDEATLIAFGALFRPLSPGDPARLHIVGTDFAGIVPKGNTDVTRRILQIAVSPHLDIALPLPAPTPAPAAPAKPTDFNLAGSDGLPAQAAPLPLPAPDTGPTLMQSIFRLWSSEGWIGRQMNIIRAAVFPGNTSLARWLRTRSGVALLLQLDPTTPDDIWLIAGPEISMTDLAAQVDLFRRTAHHDLQGQAALLQRDGTWVSWTENRSPELLEPLTLSNFRPVLGNYASWSPALFTALTILFALLSVIPALIFVLITRRNGSRI